MNELDNMKQMMLLIESAEQLDEIDFKKAAATAMAIGSLAGGVDADPGPIPGMEPKANAEYNAPDVDSGYVRQHIDQDRAKVLAYKVISGMGYDTDFSGRTPKGYIAHVDDMTKSGISIKVKHKQSNLFNNTAKVDFAMDLKGNVRDIVVYDGSEIIRDHPIFNKVMGSKISK